MMTRRINNGVFIFILFLAISYISSAWWCWSFGCAFGGRNYVEYLAIFSVPVAFLFERLVRLNRTKQILSWIIILTLIVFNMKMTYSYDGCFYSGGEWDWGSYFNIVLSPTK